MLNITAFEEGDQQSIGRGIYFTPDKNTARNYALTRSDEGTFPTVYEVEVADIDIADLRTKEAQEQFAKLHRQTLLDWEKNILPNSRGLSEGAKEMIKETVDSLVEKIDTNSWNQLKQITFNSGGLVSEALFNHGYKGLMSREGEPPKVAFHDSVVIFNPEDIKIVNQESVT